MKKTTYSRTPDNWCFSPSPGSLKLRLASYAKPDFLRNRPTSIFTWISNQAEIFWENMRSQPEDLLYGPFLAPMSLLKIKEYEPSMKQAEQMFKLPSLRRLRMNQVSLYF